MLWERRPAGHGLWERTPPAVGGRKLIIFRLFSIIFRRLRRQTLWKGAREPIFRFVVALVTSFYAFTHYHTVTTSCVLCGFAFTYCICYTWCRLSAARTMCPLVISSGSHTSGACFTPSCVGE